MHRRSATVWDFLRAKTFRELFKMLQRGVVIRFAKLLKHSRNERRAIPMYSRNRRAIIRTWILVALIQFFKMSSVYIVHVCICARVYVCVCKSDLKNCINYVQGWEFYKNNALPSRYCVLKSNASLLFSLLFQGMFNNLFFRVAHNCPWFISIIPYIFKQ